MATPTTSPSSRARPWRYSGEVQQPCSPTPISSDQPRLARCTNDRHRPACNSFTPRSSRTSPVDGSHEALGKLPYHGHMPSLRRCKYCGRFLVAAVTGFCGLCLTLPASPGISGHHSVVISIAYAEHAEPPHTPEYEVSAVHEPGDQAAYPPPPTPAPFIPPRINRGRPPLRMTGRSSRSFGVPVTTDDEIN
jgi:hypothetical protein